MIHLTRLNGTDLVINADLIETIEATPDTVLSLTTDHKWVVRESVEAVVEKVVAYKRRLYTVGPETP